MQNKDIDLENLTQDDFLEMAKYVAYIENQNGQLLEQLREAKAMLAATVHQRNSLNAKLQNLINERANTIDIKEVVKSTFNATIDAENPEMYRVPANRLGLTPKSNKQ